MPNFATHNSNRHQPAGSTVVARALTARRGFTLVELLVVVFILLLVSAASIPVVVPAMQGRHLREASRQVNSYFAVARDTSLRTGRPVGVMLERFTSRDQTGVVTGTISEMCVVLQQVEVPEPYAGDFADSRVQISGSPPVITGLGLPDPSAPDTIGVADMGWMGLVRAGDLIQLNHSGPWYQINPSGTTVMGGLMGGFPWAIRRVDGLTPVVPANSNFGLPYHIVRQPVPTSMPPLQLTGTVAIDLNWSSDSESGMFVGRDTTTLAKLTATYPPATDLVEDVRPVIIMFAPDGSLERLYRSLWVDPDGAGPDDPVWRWAGATSPRPTGPIHLLLGQREAVPANSTVGDANQATNNWRNLDNLWVSIHPQTGLITTTEVADVTDPAQRDNPFFGGLDTARSFATRAKSMGGR